jgi:GINS complex subunit 2
MSLTAGAPSLTTVFMQLEFFACQELITIVPNFSLDGTSMLYCMGGAYGPFQANSRIDVPIWLALLLNKRNKCTILPPQWLDKTKLSAMLLEEKSATQFFQPLPLYYVEISKVLFQSAVEAFGEDYMEVTGLVESIRKVRYNKIETGLKKVEEAITVKLNNLSAAECNMIRMLFKGTLDHYYQISKNDTQWQQSQIATGATAQF